MLKHRLLKELKQGLQSVLNNLYKLREKEVITLKIYDDLHNHVNKIDSVLTDIILRNFK